MGNKRKKKRARPMRLPEEVKQARGDLPRMAVRPASRSKTSLPLSNTGFSRDQSTRR